MIYPESFKRIAARTAQRQPDQIGPYQRVIDESGWTDDEVRGYSWYPNSEGDGGLEFMWENEGPDAGSVGAVWIARLWQVDPGPYSAAQEYGGPGPSEVPEGAMQELGRGNSLAEVVQLAQQQLGR